MSFIYDHRGFKTYVFVFSNEWITLSVFFNKGSTLQETSNQTTATVM